MAYLIVNAVHFCLKGNAKLIGKVEIYLENKLKYSLSIPDENAS